MENEEDFMNLFGEVEEKFEGKVEEAPIKSQLKEIEDFVGEVTPKRNSEENQQKKTRKPKTEVSEPEQPKQSVGCKFEREVRLKIEEEQIEAFKSECINSKIESLKTLTAGGAPVSEIQKIALEIAGASTKDGVLKFIASQIKVEVLELVDKKKGAEIVCVVKL